MLDFLGSVGLFLNPRAHGTENSGDSRAARIQPQLNQNRTNSVPWRSAIDAGRLPMPKIILIPRVKLSAKETEAPSAVPSRI